MICSPLLRKAIFEFEYIEVDGLLYPNIEIEGKELLDNLGKYGHLRLEYLYDYKPHMYRELLLTDKLAEHCNRIDKPAFMLSERLRAGYLETHPMLCDDTMERIHISSQAQIVADEIVSMELIYI